MKGKKSNLFIHVTNIVTVALIIECFLCALMVVRKYAQEDCFNRLRESTTQAEAILDKAMEENHEKLTVFAGILGDNSSNPDEQLQAYMETFCQTQVFKALCIHRADGSIVSYGEHPHDQALPYPFESELERLPYVSEIFIQGDLPVERCFYQAVPICREGAEVGILYGYVTLDALPSFFEITAYDGACQIYIVDGDTGNFLMDTWHPGPLGTLDGMGSRETRKGYDIAQMRDDIRQGKSGSFVFLSRTTGEWFYTYYMPTGINNWSIQMTIDEPTAFAPYHEMETTVMVLSACVIVFVFLHVIAMMLQTNAIKKNDRARLQRSNYMYEVQRALLNAHNNPDYIDQALKTVAAETGAETAMLLSFSARTVNKTYFWPSKDAPQAANLLGRNIRLEFPMLFDQLAQGKSVLLRETELRQTLSDNAMHLFATMDIRALMLVPILDTAGNLRGALSVVNMAKELDNCELLECLTYDFFMAITNIENHAIIRNMGVMDYLTNVKNRNSFESELTELAASEAEQLWCVFVDANGLREINNTKGHKTGDKMLCAVADAIKRSFGSSLTYRVGGDEFVAFARDSTQEEIAKKKRLIIAELSAMGYFVSVGFEGATRDPDLPFNIDALITAAEQTMYREKREFYARYSIRREPDGENT